MEKLNSILDSVTNRSERTDLEGAICYRLRMHPRTWYRYITGKDGRDFTADEWQTICRVINRRINPLTPYEVSDFTRHAQNA